jgi:SAM-dependent methyltransferase
MLREARSRTKEQNVRFVEGDFRDFHLHETFDAIVCSSDSLNYIERPIEILEVFQCVHEHLVSGGIFAFDALDHEAARVIGGTKVVANVDGKSFEIYYFYDRKRRVSEDRVVFEGLIERHRRIAIDEEDVRWAARKAGLQVTDHFSNPRWPSSIVPYYHVRQFYVLRKPE